MPEAVSEKFHSVANTTCGGIAGGQFVIIYTEPLKLSAWLGLRSACTLAAVYWRHFPSVVVSTTDTEFGTLTRKECTHAPPLQLVAHTHRTFEERGVIERERDGCEWLFRLDQVGPWSKNIWLRAATGTEMRHFLHNLSCKHSIYTNYIQSKVERRWEAGEDRS